MDVELVIHRTSAYPSFDVQLAERSAFRLAVGLGLPSSIENRGNVSEYAHSAAVGANGDPVSISNASGWLRFIVDP